MAPVDSDYANSNRVPLLFLLGKFVIIDLLLVQVVNYAKRASKVLPPSQTTRARAEARKKNISTFGWLAVASSLVLGYHGIRALVCSYDAWAQEHGETPPGALWDGWYAGDDELSWQLGRWWKDVDLGKEFAQPVLGTSKGLWWTQQLLLSRIAFAAFMGIEGHRRDISKSTIVSLLLLTQFAGLSVAQSLFFLLLVLMPVPAKPAQSQSHSRWTPHPAIYIGSVLFSSACVAAVPTLTSNDLGWIAMAGDFLNQLFLATAIRFIPRKWGKEHNDVHSAHEASTSIYRTIALLSFGFHLRRTFWAALLNSGDTYQRRFNFVWTTHPNHGRSISEKLFTASARILGAVSEEPVISTVGWDVLLSGFTLCTWAAVRGLDVSEMLQSIKPWPTKVEKPKDKHIAFSDKSAVKKEKTVSPSPEDSASLPSKRGRGRPKKSSAPVTPAPSTGRVLRRRAERETPEMHQSELEDPSYVPPPKTAAEVAGLEHEEERDDDAVDDAEAAALAWGLSLVGGLALTSSAVMGAELRSR